MHELRMVDTKHVFQVSGIKNLYKKGLLLERIHQLGGKYIGGSGFDNLTTHLIVTHAPMASEKFLAACAGGKWIVNPNYVLDSAKNGSWLPEEPYELDSSCDVPGAVNSVRVWRERVTSGAVAGAFQGWGVLLIIKPSQRDIFRRILSAGKATVYSSPPPFNADVTHVLTNHVAEYVKTQNVFAPCYTITHIAHYLLGEEVCSSMGLTLTQGKVDETLTGDEPVEMHTGDEPVEMHIEDEPVETHTGDEPVETHTEDEPVETHTGHEPVETHTEDEPVETHTGDEPVETHTGDEPVETHTEDEPVETHTGDEPVETHTGDEPVETHTGDEPVERRSKNDSVKKLKKHDPEGTQTCDFSEIEMEARDYIFQIENGRRLREELRRLPETMSYNTSVLHFHSSVVRFCNVQNLTECGFFTNALEELHTDLQPGKLPPALFLKPMMQHALHGKDKPLFYNMFHTVLRSILRNNPPWCSKSTESFFLTVLQCPQCMKGSWPYLETSFRFCMGSKLTCHPFPKTAYPELLRFHGDLQTFAVKLFKCDLPAADDGQAGGMESNLLNRVFWSVWDWSTLGSRPVKQLVELLVEASKWMSSVGEVPAWDVERSRRQRLVLTLQDMLGVVVDVWCHRHSRLNRSLVVRGLEDLSQHVAVLCLDLPLDVLQEFVQGIVSTRFRMVTADSIFRALCCRNHITLGTKPLSLRKIFSYLACLGELSAVRAGGDPQSDRSSPRSEPEHTGTITEMPSGLVNRAGPGKKNIPKGLNRVNMAGETVLHQTCKRNQVETLLQILAIPGIDINVKDHAGWTPLHEACNHGSHACVEALLRHRPPPQLRGQVDGVSPLHDALLCGHTDIAKTLLRHAGSDLLLQRDHDGRTPLDLVSPTMREELKHSALAGDTAMDLLGSEVRDLSLLEACSCLLKCLLLAYQLEQAQAQDAPPSLGLKLARALKKHSAQRVTAGWAHPQTVRLVEDMEAVLGVEECLARLVPAVRECQGAHTRLLIVLLEEMKEHREALLTHADTL